MKMDSPINPGDGGLIFSTLKNPGLTVSFLLLQVSIDSWQLPGHLSLAFLAKFRK